MGYSPWGHKTGGHDWATEQFLLYCPSISPVLFITTSYYLKQIKRSISIFLQSLFPFSFVLYFVFYMSAKLENSAAATGLEKVSFHSNPKER